MVPEQDTKEEVDELLPEPSCRPQRMQYDADFVTVADVGSDAVDDGGDDADVDDDCGDGVVEHSETSCNENHDCSEVVVPDSLSLVAERKLLNNAVLFDTIHGEAAEELGPEHWDHRQ